MQRLHWEWTMMFPQLLHQLLTVMACPWWSDKARAIAALRRASNSFHTSTLLWCAGHRLYAAKSFADRESKKTKQGAFRGSCLKRAVGFASIPPTGKQSTTTAKRQAHTLLHDELASRVLSSGAILAQSALVHHTRLCREMPAASQRDPRAQNPKQRDKRKRLSVFP